MDTKIKTLSDEELMEVSGGASSSGFNCINISSESECKKKSICKWIADKNPARILTGCYSANYKGDSIFPTRSLPRRRSCRSYDR